MTTATESTTRTLFTCRCCEVSTNALTNGSVEQPGWHAIYGIDGPNSICPECVADPTSLQSLIEDGYPNARVGRALPVIGA